MVTEDLNEVKGLGSRETWESIPSKSIKSPRRNCDPGSGGVLGFVQKTVRRRSLRSQWRREEGMIEVGSRRRGWETVISWSIST